MALKTDKKNRAKCLTKQEKIDLVCGNKQLSDIFRDISDDLVVSFFPNGTNEIWIKSKSDHNLGFRLKFNSTEKSLSVEINNFMFGKLFEIQSTTIGDEENASKTTWIWQTKQEKKNEN